MIFVNRYEILTHHGVWKEILGSPSTCSALVNTSRLTPGADYDQQTNKLFIMNHNHTIKSL